MAKRPHTAGLVVGKFCPLHRGHELVLRAALEACDQVWVITYVHDDFGFPLKQREGWLRSFSPRLRVLGLDPDSPRPFGVSLPADDADGGIHRDFVCWVLDEWAGAGRGGHLDWPTAVFTSEEYGAPLAEHLTWRGRGGGLLREDQTVEHVLVDLLRQRVRTSGTELRRSRAARPGLLSPRVARDLGRRVVLLGAESTGKTTMAQALAAELGCAWVPEYGRQRWDERGGQLTAADMLDIAREQARLEEDAPLAAGGWLVCDTSPLTTLLYAEHLCGVELAALMPGTRFDSLIDWRRRYDLTLLLTPEVPLVQDGTRQDDPGFRARQHAWYVDRLAAAGAAPVLIRGDNYGARLNQALWAIGRA